MAAGHGSLLHLKEDWRKLLFPEATDAQFADGYAQAVTFGLLMARAFEISLKDGVELAAIRLKKTNTLIGTALNVLTEDDANQQSLKTSLDTLRRVLNEVNWSTISKDKPEAWLYFYQDFLEIYDNRLRKLTGSYYTPPEVVSAMTNLVDQALRGPLFERAAGLASPDVTLADPRLGREHSCSERCGRSLTTWRLIRARALSGRRSPPPPSGCSASNCNSGRSRSHNCA